MTGAVEPHVEARAAEAASEAPCLDAALARANDALARQAAALASLQAALTHQAALLRERDHRVGNTLQVIASLSLLKARRLPPGEARDVLQAMAERVGVLSLAQRRRDGAGDAGFDLRDFAADLIGDLAAGLDPERIAVDVAVEPIPCPGAMATPLALLLHELTANALRHAFPGGRRGRVRIEAARVPEGLHLAVSDDGVGLAGASADPSGFGRGLVEMLARQLNGRAVWADADPGTRVAIAVPLAPPDGP